MEDLFGALFAFIIVVISVAVKNSKMKVSSSTSRNPKDKKLTEAVVDAMFNQQSKPVQPVRMQKAQTPAATPVVQAQPKVRQSAQPKVHTHLAPSCDLDADLSGSMLYDSPEGTDKCHEEELRPVHQPLQAEEPVQEKSGLTLDFSADAMVQAIVMQEVLTRPCDRRRR